MTEITMFDSIMLWDKILDNSERSQLVTSHWISSCESRQDQAKVDETIAMKATNMDEMTMLRMHEAFKLSTRTSYFRRKLEKLDVIIAKKWDNIISKFKNRTSNTDKAYTNVLKYDILPVQVMNAQLKGNYDFQHLSYIIKNMLRASYNPDNGRFEPLIICGTYNDEYGVR